MRARLPPRLLALIPCVIALTMLLDGCVTENSGGGPHVGSASQRLHSQLDLGRGYLRAGDKGKARSALEKALQIDSTSWEAYDLMGALHSVEGENALAEKAWRNAVRYGGGARARRNLAAYLSHSNRVEEACKELQAATEDLAYEYRAQVFADLGTCDRSRGLTKQALASYRRATELNDNQSDAWFGIADMSLDAGDILVAAAAYQKFRRIGQQDARSLLLGVRLGRAEKDVNAEASAALMLRNLFPDSAEYRRYKEMTP